jgi:hypothetical protein
MGLGLYSVPPPPLAHAPHHIGILTRLDGRGDSESNFASLHPAWRGIDMTAWEGRRQRVRGQGKTPNEGGEDI